MALVGHLSLAWLALVVPALLLQILMTFGIGCIAATLTAFVRDTAHAVGIALTVVFYATPIVYPASLVPERLRWVLEANPVAHLVDLYRRAFTLHALPEAGSVLLSDAVLRRRGVGRGCPFPPRPAPFRRPDLRMDE